MISKIKTKGKSWLSIYRQYSDPKAVFVYQMGKVGSTALEQAIPNSIHIHNFYSENHPCPPRQLGLAGFGWCFFFKRVNQQIEYLIKRMAFKAREKTKIITLVRPPVERNVSMFLHDLDSYLFALYTNCDCSVYPPMPTREQSADVLMTAFKQHFNHDYPLDWFDCELLKLTGINIYDTTFNKQLGYSFALRGKIEVLCIDMQRLSEHEKRLSEFTSSHVKLRKVNVGALKWYASLQDKIKTQVANDINYRDRLESSQYYRHFFAEEK